MTLLEKEIRTVWRARALVWVLTRREIAARNAGSAGGWLWSYAQPLLMAGAYYLVFDVVFAMRLGKDAPVYGAGTFLIVGALPWMAFCDAVSRSMNSLIDAGNLLQRSPLPPVLFPMRSALASTLIHAPIIFALALVYAPLHNFNLALVALLPLIVLQLILSLILGYLLAIFAAAMRDTLQIVAFLLSVGIFLSPVLFPINMFPQAWRWILWMNPMSAPITAYQAILLQGTWPVWTTWLVIIGWALVSTALLAIVVSRSHDQLDNWL